MIRRMLDEIALLKACRSNHIVNYLGYTISDNELQLVTELMAGGDLMVAIQQKRVTWRRYGAQIALDIASGLHYLHSRSCKVVHLDLKSSNVLLSRNYRAKINDVGLSQVLPLSKSYIASGATFGTFAWSAPEQLMGKRCTTSADIYSFGVVLWEVCSGETPVRGYMRQLTADDCPPEIDKLIQRCWEFDPTARPTAAECIEALEKLQGEKKVEGQVEV